MGFDPNAICGPVLGTTAYSNNTLVGRNVNITLPEVTPQTIDMQAMGTMSLPIWHLLEDLEFAITKIGTDLGLGAMLGGKKLSLEVRWAQESVDGLGNLREFGCKAFVSGFPKIIPGSEITPGETTENEMTYTVARYQLIVDEEEIVKIDRFANQCFIAGTDYARDISTFL